MNNNNKIENKFKEIIKHKEEIKNLIKNFNKKYKNNELKKLQYKYIKIKEIILYFNELFNIEKEIESIYKINNFDDIKSLVEEEKKKLYSKKYKIEKDINLLINNYKNIYSGCFLEIRSGTGGIESSLFINDLYKMYTKYSYNKNWNIDLISRITNNQGGYKEIILKIESNIAYNYLKFESGGHRVQRIPETESQGRVHTSTCTVAVIPILPEKEFKNIKPIELRIDTFKSSGAGGQHVNTTDSAIRITHIPTGLVVECQDERSQHKNKSKAMLVLQSRLYILEKEKEKKEKNDLRKNLFGSGIRSDRIRTYNFIQNRITDHRKLFSSYRLYEILNGNLDILINLFLEKK